MYVCMYVCVYIYIYNYIKKNRLVYNIQDIDKGI